MKPSPKKVIKQSRKLSKNTNVLKMFDKVYEQIYSTSDTGIIDQEDLQNNQMKKESI